MLNAMFTREDPLIDLVLGDWTNIENPKETHTWNCEVAVLPTTEHNSTHQLCWLLLENDKRSVFLITIMQNNERP